MHGISSATFGSLGASLMTRMKELENENRHLKKRYVDIQLSADLLRLTPTFRVTVP